MELESFDHFVDVQDNSQDDIQLSDIEKLAIEKVLIENNYNISKSANKLGISRAALYRRMEKYGLR